MAMVFLKKYWIKYFNHSLPPNQQDREQDWVYRLSYDIVKAHGGEIKVWKQKKEKEPNLLLQLPRMPNIKINNEDHHWVDFILFLSNNGNCPKKNY